MGECRSEELGFPPACFYFVVGYICFQAFQTPLNPRRWEACSELDHCPSWYSLVPDFTNWFLSKPWIWGTNVFLSNLASWEGKLLQIKMQSCWLCKKPFGFSWVSLKLHYFNCKTFKSTLPNVVRSSSLISGSKFLKKYIYAFSVVMDELKNPVRVSVESHTSSSSMKRSNVYSHLVFSYFNSQMDVLWPPRRSSLKYKSHFL